MNDSLYEDYMRSVLGYQPMNNYQDTYNYNSYDNYSSYDAVPVMAHMQNQGMQMMNNMMPMQNQNMQFKSLSGGFAEHLKVAASIYHILLYLYLRSILECHSDILLTVNRHEIHQA